MADYYKSLNLEKQRQQMQSTQKEEFTCNENLTKFAGSMSKHGANNNRAMPGFQSSSEEL